VSREITPEKAVQEDPTLAARYFIALLAVVLATSVRMLLDPYLGYQHPFLTYFIAVTFVAWYGGLGPALVSLALGFLAADWFFIPPVNTFEIFGVPNAVGVALYFFIGLTSAGISEAQRNAQRRAEANALDAARKRRELEIVFEESTKADEAREATERRFQALIENSQDAVAVTTPDGVVTYASPAVTRMLGYPQEALIGHNSLDLIHPEDLGRVTERLGPLINAPGRSITLEFRYRREDGSWCWLESTISNLLHEPFVEAVVSNFRDVTERKHAEEELRRRTEALEAQHGWLEAVLNLMPAPMLFIEPGTARVTFANRAADEVAGGPFPKNTPAAEYHTVFYCTDTEGRRIPDEEMPGVRIARGERLAGFEMDWHLPDGVKSLLVFGDMMPATPAHPAVALLSFHDITPQKRVEAELRRANAAKEEFLAMLGHELRNPLAAISNAQYVLERQPNPDPLVLRLREVIGRQTRHLSRLVDDLLDVARVTQGKVEIRKEPVELAQIVTRAVEASQTVIDDRRLTLALTLPPGPVPLEADATRLEQVIVNLLSNAAKYTDPGGHVALDVEVSGGPDDGPVPARPTAVIRVRDTGIGIAADVLPHVFDLFVQSDRALDRSQGGLGIGLTLVKSLVQMHDGSVEAHSGGPGQGSEFVVRLPVLRSSEFRVPSSGGGTPVLGGFDSELSTRNLELPAQHRKVLVVDDNEDAAETVAELVELWGHTVQVAHNGRQALEVMQTYHPDVVLCDIGMPGMDGYEVAQRVRAAPPPGENGTEPGPRPLLVALTGYGREEDRARAREAGFDRHFTKPVSPEALRDLLGAAPCPSGPAPHA
jgi:PAS domain S-box-containing protein